MNLLSRKAHDGEEWEKRRELHRAHMLASEVGAVTMCLRYSDSTVKLAQEKPVKKISCLRSQDKKAPEFSHFIKISLLKNFPFKK
jgi:hypothetical protein